MARFCKKCGNEIKGGAAFCGKCGTPVQRSDQTAQPGMEQNKAQNLNVNNADNSKRGFFAGFKDELMDYFKHPVKLLPAVILTVIWIAFSLLGTLGRNTPVIQAINTITYSNGGMYGGIIGSIGGVFGKAFFAAVITSLVNTLISKKNPFSGNGIRFLFGGAASSGLFSVAPFLLGSGTGLVLYWFFNITSTPKNLMVAVAGAAAAVISLISGHGLLFSLLSGIAGKLTRGKFPASTFISRTLTGFAAGFAVGIPVTFLRRSWIIIAAGALILGVGILFLLIGKNGAKRVAAGAAVILIAGGLLMPFAGIVKAADTSDEVNALTGNYTGQIIMVTGQVTDYGYEYYSNGKMGLDSFVKTYMGGGLGKLSQAELDDALDRIISQSDIEAVKGQLQIDSKDPGSGKCTISFSLLAGNCSWKAKEDAFKLGADNINITLEGTYSDSRITISSASGDAAAAAGTIDVSEGNGKIQIRSDDLVIAVINEGVPTYYGLLSVDAEMGSGNTGHFKDLSKDPITIDDIEGVYLYTGMNYATEEISDAYYRVELLGGNMFRFSSLDPAPGEAASIDWEALYGQNGSDVTLTDNNVDLSLYYFNEATAYSQTDVSITGVKVVEHYDLGWNASVEVYSSETRSYDDIQFSRGDDGRIHAVYENHFDFDVGSFSTWDHLEMVKVDYYPGASESAQDFEKPPVEPVIDPETDTAEIETKKPGKEAETKPEEDDNDHEDDHYWSYDDEDYWDLPHSTTGKVADSVGTALFGGGGALLVGSIAGALGGSGGGGGPDGEGSGREGPDGPGPGGDSIPYSWIVSKDGDISFIDPSSGKTVTYTQTGFDPDTGDPIYHNAESWGQPYDINDLKEMYDRTAREKDYYKNIKDNFDKARQEQREENQGPSWEARDWAREKKEIAEKERQEDYKNKLAYSHGVYDGDKKEFKKAVIKDQSEAYKDQAYYESRSEYFNAGYQTAQTVQKGADVAIDIAEKGAELTGNPGVIAAAKTVKKGYIAGKNIASNAGELMSGQKNFGQAVADATIGTTADLIKEGADGFRQKVLYNVTMEGGKTVYQGWIDGKSAEEIRNDTIKNMNKGLADAVNDASIDSVVPDGLVGTGLKSLTNNVLNNPNED